MLINPKRCCWTLATIAMLVAGCYVAAPESRAQTRPVTSTLGQPTAAAAPEKVAAFLWRTIAATCPVQGSTSPTTFLRSYGMLVEYRDARTHLYPWLLTKADELNGIAFKGAAVLRADANRYIEEGDEWSSWQPELLPNADFSKEKDFRGYWPGAWTVVVEKRNGQWLFSSLFFRIRGSTLNVNSLATTAPKLSCAELTSNNPLGPAAGGDRGPRVINLVPKK